MRNTERQEDTENRKEKRKKKKENKAVKHKLPLQKI
jgi:hypothetical protein